MTPRVKEYVRIASLYHGVQSSVVLGRKRTKNAAAARAAVMRWLRSDGFSTAQIGRWMDRDHSTVVHATRGRCNGG